MLPFLNTSQAIEGLTCLKYAAIMDGVKPLKVAPAELATLVATGTTLPLASSSDIMFLAPKTPMPKVQRLVLFDRIIALSSQVSAEQAKSQ